MEKKSYYFPLITNCLPNGSGLRLMECIRLRVQDVDFGQNLIFIRGGKGGKDRTTMLPQNLRDELQSQINAVKSLHHKELEAGFGEVYIPEALARKYPNASRETGWQWVFPAKLRSRDPRSGKEMRHHVLESALQKAVKRAAQETRIDKRVGYEVSQWYGVVTSAKAPQAIVNALSEEIALSAQDPEVVERLKKDGVDAVSSKPEELNAHIKSEVAKWGTLVKDASLKLQ